MRHVSIHTHKHSDFRTRSDVTYMEYRVQIKLLVRRDGLVSVVTGCGLETGVRFPGGTWIFSLPATFGQSLVLTLIPV
jgi:hypothetical protein